MASAASASHPSVASHSDTEVGIMELPLTRHGNQYVIVFQHFLRSLFSAPDQKAITSAWLLAGEIFPLFGVPQSLLSACGHLAHVMQNVCELLGIDKLYATTYHLDCD